MKDQTNSPLNLLLEQIDQRRSAVDALRPFTSDQEGRIMQKFRLDWNYHSNAIEGNALTYGETIAFLMEGLTAKGKPFKDHLDIRGHNEGIDYLMQIIQNRDQLSEKIIRELHAMILVEPYSNPAQTTDGQQVEKRVTLGAYKTMPNHVKTPTGEIHFYATPEETPAKMTDLMDWLRQHQEKNDLSPLQLAAIFHYKFVAIHPFDDGNGRMSRLLMNLLLMQNGYPPVVIKQQDRQAYYYALRQADAGELDSFVEYIGDNLLHSLEIQLKGARGESMEEPDDLDKEIALLKGSLGEEEDVVKKSEVVIRQLILDLCIPLFQEIRKQCRKIDDFFYETNNILIFPIEYFMSFISRGNLLTTPPTLENALAMMESINAYNKLASLSYQYTWVEFKKSKDLFTLSSIIKVSFRQLEYDIEFEGMEGNPKISKPYAQKLTPEEFTDLSKIFVREALEQIKARTGK